MSSTDAVGAILAGGRSTRMGRDKAQVLVCGHTMLEIVGMALEQVTRRVVVLGPDRRGWECWPDSVHAEGPLAGIATALSRIDTDRLLIAAVDHPFVRVDTLRHLLENADGDLPLVPVDDQGTRQVTCAVYPSDISEAAVDEAAAGGSIQSLLDRVSFRPVTPAEWSSWGEDGRSWFSADTLEALEAGLVRFGAPSALE